MASITLLNLQELLFPWLFLFQSLRALPALVLHLLLSLDFATLTSPSRLKYAWFSRFWAVVGPRVRDNAERRVVPLLQGRVSGGAVVPDAVHPPVSGTVIEIGPGSGMWVSLFSEGYLDNATTKPSTPQKRTTRSTSAPAVKRVFGVEPNTDVHPALRQRIAAAGLSDTYEVVPLGIEDLASSGRVPRESVDCVVSVLCLCGIPDPQHNVREVYQLLKPGGRWYAYEHVRCTHGFFMRTYQGFINLLWPHFLGGCELNRDTGRTLREAGPWSKVDLERCVDENWSAVIPHVLGVLTK